MADYLKKGSLKPDLKIAKHTKDTYTQYFNKG